MSRTSSPLNNIKIASPCSADWAMMYGSERKRFCGDCKLNVYNISGMTLKEAETLLEQSEGRLCVRYYRRTDGTILTKDCPVGLARVKYKVSRFAAAAFSLIVGMFSGLFLMSFFAKDARSGGAFPIKLTDPQPDYPIMGAIAIKEPTGPNYRPVEVGKIVVPITRTKNGK